MGELKFIPGYNPNANEKVGTGRENSKFWQEEEAKVLIYDKKKKELEARTTETAKLKKVAGGSIDLVISPETANVKAFMRENFEISLSSVESDIEEATKCARDLRDGADNELKAHLQGIRINDLGDRLKSLQEIYKRDEFPELLGRLKDALMIFDNLKANHRFEDKKRA
ncbi:MAG: hypothetical protein US66_C0035G0007 [Candidatus Moranbacteria bacterium GW2011_GWD2_37_9]|nr:MAG: hypothetical protein US66_C0035G0007 [Candidatus Moranbacteria bacterium GW2011_GWD2_37_9]